ncbi:Exodeoxyribonuclease 7 small subunit [Synechococcus sp. MIT S9509]|uniref:exodeoxyribonuclease VII small subunit n=1 Tax=unclassified Synechococcus TaxID=2626047 RepID=UPI0007BB459F|nr:MULTISPECIES: exodeoxyribonuclease VII small subunit [unclassified Synechococcus]KZR83457.1 Exodeoxyribonuclease 7 small subunit [Synechococcus sp. MIT S9504]KZR88455.1 Exodeoxyribonuclease 7 small subunit [Synechococcus sp. MIT S9509]
MPKKSPTVKNDPQVTWRKDAEALNYEEALQALDLLLAKLQDESLPLSELQSSHQRAEIYLSRCEQLLSETEQSVLQLDPQTLTTQRYESETYEQRNDA